MKAKTSSIILGAAIAGIIGAASVPSPVLAADKPEMGLCKGASSCSGKGACGETKGKNSCKGKGAALMTKVSCEKKKHEWTPAPKADEKKPEATAS